MITPPIQPEASVLPLRFCSDRAIRPRRICATPGSCFQLVEWPACCMIPARFHTLQPSTNFQVRENKRKCGDQAASKVELPERTSEFRVDFAVKVMILGLAIRPIRRLPDRTNLTGYAATILLALETGAVFEWYGGAGKSPYGLETLTTVIFRRQRIAHGL